MGDFFPWIYKLDQILPSKYTKVMRKNLDIGFQLFREIVEGHKKDLDESSPKDLIDAFLIQIAMKTKETPESAFYGEEGGKLQPQGVQMRLILPNTLKTTM